jgi:hypothetical protein
MDATLEKHVSDLRSVAEAPVRVFHPDQFSRYFWLPSSQTPPCLTPIEHAIEKLRSEYATGCRDAKRFWRKRLGEACPSVVSALSQRSGSSIPVIFPDEKALSLWKTFSARDNVGRIMIDPLLGTAAPKSLYSDSFLSPEYSGSLKVKLDRSHHIKANPISKFGEALFRQRDTIR